MKTNCRERIPAYTKMKKGYSQMENAIITKGRLESSRRIILDEDIPDMGDSFEIIILRRNPAAKDRPARKAGTLKGMIHMKDDFDEPLEDFKEYME
ncbi:MAG: DUF2281 domain-containing protein [Desulfobacteraceae bacterium]|nr:DUF2281 domain-containing protein [Desulfobacteraceae bacterium]